MRDWQINEASFEDIWSEDHFCRISGYDIECVVKSLWQMAFHDGDWITMIKITDKVKVSEDTHDLVMGIAERLKQLPWPHPWAKRFRRFIPFRR